MKINKQQLVQLVVGAAFGAAGGYFGVKLGRGMGDFAPVDGPAQKTLTLATAFFGLWFALAFHELAHLVTGLAQGFRFHLYVAGFLGVRREAADGRIRWYVNTDPQLFGGVAATLPQAQTPDLTQRFARLVVAGPLGSLFLTLVGGLAGWGLMHAESVGWRMLAVFFLTSGFTSFLLFLATTVPSRTGMFFTDRARYFRLVSGGPTAEVERAMLELIAFVNSGQPLEQLDLSLVEIVQRDKDYALYAELYAYYHYLATDQREAAIALAERLKALPDGMPAVFQVEFWKEICFAEAYLKHDTEAAGAWWQKIEKQVAKRPDATGLRAKAAWLRLQGHADEAGDTARQALALLRKKNNRTAAEHLEERLLEVLCTVPAQQYSQSPHLSVVSPFM